MLDTSQKLWGSRDFGSWRIGFFRLWLIMVEVMKGIMLDGRVVWACIGYYQLLIIIYY